jgi:hypothetical protein
MNQICVCCNRSDRNHSKRLKVHEKNLRLFKLFNEEINLGPICGGCYYKRKSELLKNPNMNLGKLYCGICKLEENQTTFGEKFQNVDGTNLKNLEMKTGKDDIIHGPICQVCDCKYLRDVKETLSPKKNEKIQMEEVVDLRKYFKDEFLNLPQISKFSENKI